MVKTIISIETRISGFQPIELANFTVRNARRMEIPTLAKLFPIKIVIKIFLGNSRSLLIYFAAIGFFCEITFNFSHRLRIMQPPNQKRKLIQRIELERLSDVEPHRLPN